jgi:uncharacterized protein
VAVEGEDRPVIVVDTTILVYTVEVLQEFAHVRARRRGRADARALAAQFVDLLSPLVLPDADDLARGMDLFVAHEQLGAFDAVLAAAVIGREHLTSIVSADRAFAAIASVHHVDPADAAAVGALLSSG